MTTFQVLMFLVAASSHHVAHKTILVTAPKYRDTSYFWFREVQDMIFQLSLSLPEFYFSSMVNVFIV